MSRVAESPEQTLYDSDFYAWTQQQAELLRKLRTTGTQFPEHIDLDHVAEEIEDMGKSQLDSVESQIENIFVHVLKSVSVPDAAPARKWHLEADRFSTDLLRRFTNAMRQRLDLDRTWRLAVRRARVDLNAYEDHLPRQCPFDLGELVDEDFDFAALVAKLRLVSG